MNADHCEDEFAAAWNDFNNTCFELKPVDVNRVLTEEYGFGEAPFLTRSQLWDMEVRKAVRPDLFITKVIREGTARSWGRRQLECGDEFFIRVSEQRLWLKPEIHDTVIEACYLNHKDQRVTFIGLDEVEDESGRIIRATDRQPLFHVEHGVKGSEESPLNTWKIVHLSGDEEGLLARCFEEIGDLGGLPEYVERYIEDVLHTPLHKGG